MVYINTWKNTLRMRYLFASRENSYYGVPASLSEYILFVSLISLFFIYINLWGAKAAFLAFVYDEQCQYRSCVG